MIGEKYAALKASGAYCGSMKDESWDRKLKKHKCCGSKKAIYHGAKCPVRSENLDDIKIPPVKQDPLRERIQALKAEGKTSGEVAKELGIKLGEVNNLWAK